MNKEKLKSNKSWIAFLEEINDAKKQIGFGKAEECFYRGHPQADWKLCPSLLRDINAYKKNFISADRWAIESDLYYEFRSRARALHNQEMSDWDVLFSMQHHRVPTRLLDWTEMFGVALYFALTECTKGQSNRKSPCIWLMNPYKLNDVYHESDDLFDPENLNTYNPDDEASYSDLLLGYHDEEKGKMFYWDEPIALYPIRKNDRLTNQGGYFTIHGNNIQPIEDLKERSKFLRKVDLPADAIDDAFDFLEQAGINDFTMFPDLDGLAIYLKKKYLTL